MKIIYILFHICTLAEDKTGKLSQEYPLDYFETLSSCSKILGVQDISKRCSFECRGVKLK